MENLKGFKRNSYCGELRTEDVGKEISVCGWVQRRRDLGQLIFIDIRDRTGILQLAFDENTDEDMFAKAGTLRSEYVIAARGTLRERSNKNSAIPTGDVELEVSELRLLDKAETPPFEITENSAVNEALRLKYRYLDLRRPDMQAHIALRHKAVKIARDFFDEHGFLDIETPILTKSTPEGARDYLVPSRVHPGKFYALPQSPQQYKQLLMLAGFDRYMTIVRCFRDEDLRADRQPEFTQIDIEMSFVDMDDVLEINELFVKRLFKDALGLNIETPIQRITYKEAMDRFGSDKPDLRYDIELKDISDIVKSCSFNVFSEPVKQGGSVRMIYLPEGGKLPRKQIDALVQFAKDYGAKGLAWTKLSEDGSVSSSYAKFLTDTENREIYELAGAKAGGLILIVADADNEVVYASLGALRCECAKLLELIPKNEFKLVWITEFPLFEYSAEDERYYAKHHPFTAPMDSDIDLLETDKAVCRAKAYDLVINGYEVAGGSIRIHNSHIQKLMFQALGFTEDEAMSRFGHIINAFTYGAPPHGGIAYGMDRLVMLLAGLHNIRDVIAFPKVQNASEPMMSSPDFVEKSHLDELSLALTVDTP